ncbi:NFATC2-interacting protein [Centroberyx affinis]|uniref:NFATC2-interacting protein n=1 Tax=Centroberyx affinis TaxID=166261 RepID=UPI003A5BF95D
MSDSDSDLEVITPLKPLPKRRRIIDPSTIASVPIYSNKVNTCLQLKPSPAVLAETENTGDSAEASLWSQSPPKKPVRLSLSDSEEEEAETVQKKSEEPEDVRSPSPPPPTGTPAAKVSSRVSRKIHEINRQLGAVSSLLSPSPEMGGRRSRRSRRTCSAPLEEEEEVEQQYSNDNDNDDDDDDIIIVTPGAGPRGSPSAREGSPLTAREIPLKVRCRTDLHKIPVLSSAPLSKVVDELSVKLQVPPSRILLLRKEVELSTHLTANELGLGIADIIDCVVMAADEKQRPVEDDSNVITVRLQGKEKGSTQEYSLHREAPLGSVLSQYLSGVSGGARHKVQFFFDGSKIAHSQTPSDLDMEDGDVIEVWT